MSRSFLQRAAEDFFYYFAFGVGVVLDVFPFAFGEVAFGAFVVGAVVFVGAEPIAEGEHSLDFDGSQFGGEYVEVDAVRGTVLDALDKAAVLIPVWLADAVGVTDSLHGGDIGGFVGGVRDQQQDVDQRFGGEARHGGGAVVLDAQDDRAEGGADLGFIVGVPGGPFWVVILDDHLDRVGFQLADGRGRRFL